MTSSRAVFATTVPITLRKFHSGTVAVLQQRGFTVTLISSPGGDLDAIALETGMSVVPISMSRGMTPVADLGALAQWLRTLWDVRPDVLFAGTPKCALLAMSAGALLRVPRRVYICGGLRHEGERGWRRRLLVSMEKLAMHSATEVVVNSRSLREEVLAARLVKEEKLRQTIPGSSHGVDAEHFRPMTADPELCGSLGLDHSAPILGFVGRLTHDKGIDTLIAAVRSLKAAGSDCQLLVVGPQDEPDSHIYVRRLEATGVPLALTGSVEDVRPYFALMTLHLLPSLREGFPNVVLEAAAMELPTITTKATGCRDSVLDGVTGRLFDTTDSVALTKTIKDLIDNPQDREEMGRRAREWVVQEFLPVKIANDIVGGGGSAVGIGTV